MPNIRRCRYICLRRPGAWRFRRCARLLTSPYHDCVLGLLASRTTHEQFSVDCPDTRSRSSVLYLWTCCLVRCETVRASTMCCVYTGHHAWRVIMRADTACRRVRVG